jgi:hypothetical protein
MFHSTEVFVTKFCSQVKKTAVASDSGLKAKNQAPANVCDGPSTADRLSASQAGKDSA